MSGRELKAQKLEVNNLVSKIQDEETLRSQKRDGPTFKNLIIAWVILFLQSSNFFLLYVGTL